MRAGGGQGALRASPSKELVRLLVSLSGSAASSLLSRHWPGDTEALLGAVRDAHPRSTEKPEFAELCRLLRPGVQATPTPPRQQGGPVADTPAGRGTGSPSRSSVAQGLSVAQRELRAREQNITARERALEGMSRELSLHEARLLQKEEQLRTRQAQFTEILSENELLQAEITRLTPRVACTQTTATSCERDADDEARLRVAVLMEENRALLRAAQVEADLAAASAQRRIEELERRLAECADEARRAEGLEVQLSEALLSQGTLSHEMACLRAEAERLVAAEGRRGAEREAELEGLAAALRADAAAAAAAAAGHRAEAAEAGAAAERLQSALDAERSTCATLRASLDAQAERHEEEVLLLQGGAGGAAAVEDGGELLAEARDRFDAEVLQLQQAHDAELACGAEEAARLRAELREALRQGEAAQRAERRLQDTVAALEAEKAASADLAGVYERREGVMQRQAADNQQQLMECQQQLADAQQEAAALRREYAEAYDELPQQEAEVEAALPLVGVGQPPLVALLQQPAAQCDAAVQVEAAAAAVVEPVPLVGVEGRSFAAAAARVPEAAAAAVPSGAALVGLQQQWQRRQEEVEVEGVAPVAVPQEAPQLSEASVSVSVAAAAAGGSPAAAPGVVPQQPQLSEASVSVSVPAAASRGSSSPAAAPAHRPPLVEHQHQHQQQQQQQQQQVSQPGPSTPPPLPASPQAAVATPPRAAVLLRVQECMLSVAVSHPPQQQPAAAPAAHRSPGLRAAGLPSAAAPLPGTPPPPLRPHEETMVSPQRAPAWWLPEGAEGAEGEGRAEAVLQVQGLPAPTTGSSSSGSSIGSPGVVAGWAPQQAPLLSEASVSVAAAAAGGSSSIGSPAATPGVVAGTPPGWAPQQAPQLSEASVSVSVPAAAAGGRSSIGSSAATPGVVAGAPPGWAPQLSEASVSVSVPAAAAGGRSSIGSPAATPGVVAGTPPGWAPQQAPQLSEASVSVSVPAAASSSSSSVPPEGTPTLGAATPTPSLYSVSWAAATSAAAAAAPQPSPAATPTPTPTPTPPAPPASPPLSHQSSAAATTATTAHAHTSTTADAEQHATPAHPSQNPPSSSWPAGVSPVVAAAATPHLPLGAQEAPQAQGMQHHPQPPPGGCPSCEALRHSLSEAGERHAAVQRTLAACLRATPGVSRLPELERAAQLQAAELRAERALASISDAASAHADALLAAAGDVCSALLRDNATLVNRIAEGHTTHTRHQQDSLATSAALLHLEESEARSAAEAGHAALRAALLQQEALLAAEGGARGALLLGEAEERLALAGGAATGRERRVVEAARLAGAASSAPSVLQANEAISRRNVVLEEMLAASRLAERREDILLTSARRASTASAETSARHARRAQRLLAIVSAVEECLDSATATTTTISPATTPLPESGSLLDLCRSGAAESAGVEEEEEEAAAGGPVGRGDAVSGEGSPRTSSSSSSSLSSQQASPAGGGRGEGSGAARRICMAKLAAAMGSAAEAGVEAVSDDLAVARRENAALREELASQAVRAEGVVLGRSADDHLQELALMARDAAAGMQAAFADSAEMLLLQSLEPCLATVEVPCTAFDAFAALSPSEKLSLAGAVERDVAAAVSVPPEALCTAGVTPGPQRCLTFCLRVFGAAGGAFGAGAAPPSPSPSSRHSASPPATPTTPYVCAESPRQLARRVGDRKATGRIVMAAAERVARDLGCHAPPPAAPAPRPAASLPPHLRGSSASLAGSHASSSLLAPLVGLRSSAPLAPTTSQATLHSQRCSDRNSARHSAAGDHDDEEDHPDDDDDHNQEDDEATEVVACADSQLEMLRGVAASAAEAAQADADQAERLASDWMSAYNAAMRWEEAAQESHDALERGAEEVRILAASLQAAEHNFHLKSQEVESWRDKYDCLKRVSQEDIRRVEEEMGAELCHSAELLLKLRAMHGLAVEEVSLLSTELERLQQENVEVKTSAHVADQTLADVHRDLEIQKMARADGVRQLADDCRRVASELHGAQAEVRRYSELLEEAKQESTELGQQVEALRVELEGQRQTTADLLAEKQLADERLAKESAEASRVRGMLQQSRDKLQTTAFEAVNLRGTLSTTVENAKQKEALTQALTSEKEKLRRQQSEYQKEVDQARRDKASAVSQIQQEVDGLVRQLGKAVGEARAAAEKHQAMREVNERLAASLKKEQEKATQALDAAEDAVTRCGAATAEASEASRARAAAEENLAELQSRYDGETGRLSRTVARLEAEVAELSTQTAETGTTNLQLAAKVRELTEELEETTQRLTEMERSLAATSAQHADAASKRDALQAENSHIREELDTLKREGVALKEAADATERARLQKENDALRGDLAGAEGSAATMRQESEALRQELIAKTYDLQGVSDAASDARRATHESGMTLLKQRVATETAKGMASKLRERLSEEEARVAALQERLGFADAENARLQRSAAALASEAEELRGAVASHSKEAKMEEMLTRAEELASISTREMASKLGTEARLRREAEEALEYQQSLCSASTAKFLEALVERETAAAQAVASGGAAARGLSVDACGGSGALSGGDVSPRRDRGISSPPPPAAAAAPGRRE